MVEKIGIVGGGQLGRMLTEAAQPLGFEVTVIDPTPNCPAAQVGAKQIEGGLNDEEAIQRLVNSTDVTTWEIEHINAKFLGELATRGHNIQPDPETLEMMQDKYKQKWLLAMRGLPVGPFDLVSNELDLEKAVEIFGDGIIIKSRLGAYDGRGNLLYKYQPFDELQATLGSSIYAEKIVNFEKELAVIAARDINGNIVVYPTVETIHKDNICRTVISPAEIDPVVAENAEEIAHETLRHLGGAGVFAIEMFQTDKDVIINEIAPRVHNSGHHTIEANVTSQFEQHIRAITGMPLGSTAMRVPAAAMINILGTREEPLSREGLDKVLAMPDAHPHFYGKSSRAARKIGHITVLGSNGDEAKQTAMQARKALII